MVDNLYKSSFVKTKTCSCILGIIIYFVSFNSQAQKVIPFSGIGYTAEKSVARNSMPYSFQFIGDLELGSKSDFVQALDQAAGDIELSNGSILSVNKENKLETLNESLVVALALESERMKTISLSPSEYQMTFDLDAQILTFNFKTKSIVAAYPMRLTLVNVLDQEPTDQDLEALAKVMFEGDPKQNLFDDLPRSYLIDNFMARVQNISIKPDWLWKIRIKDIEFSEMASQVLANHGLNQDQIRQLAASSLSSSLSTTLNIPILPYVKSDAIRDSMTIKFSDTDLMDLRIPRANFHINLVFRGFGSRELKSTERVSVKSFVSGIRVSVEDNDRGKVFLDAKLQSGNLKKLSKEAEVDLWSEYETSFISLLDQIVSQFDKPDDKWMKEHASDKKRSKQLVKDFQRVNDRVIRLFRAKR